MALVLLFLFIIVVKPLYCKVFLYIYIDRYIYILM